MENHEEKDGPSEAVLSLRDLYSSELAALFAASDAETGWPSKEDCDGTLWAGLAAAAGGDWVRLELAERESGVIHRRPTPCWTPEAGDVGSKSTVSRDMMTGYMFGWWRRGQVEPLQRLANYGADHGWVMGQPEDREQEVALGDNLKGTLCRSIQVLSRGADKRSCADVASYYFPVFPDYARHIQTLAVLLYGEVDAGLRASDARPPEEGTHPEMPLVNIDGEMLNRLRENAEWDKADGLFAAALGVYTGDYARAIELLSSPGYQCPSYVRGAPTYCHVHKAFAMSVVLKHHGGVHAGAQ